MESRTLTAKPDAKSRFQITKLEERIAPKRASTQSVTQVGLLNINANVAVAANVLSPGATAIATIF